MNGIWAGAPNGSGDVTPVFLDDVGYMTVNYSTSLSWSADREYIAFVRDLPSEPLQIWITAADGTEPPRQIPGVNSGFRTGLAWAPR